MDYLGNTKGVCTMTRDEIVQELNDWFHLDGTFATQRDIEHVCNRIDELYALLDAMDGKHNYPCYCMWCCAVLDELGQ